MYGFDWVEISRIVFSSVVGTLVTNILAFAIQRLLIERRMQESMELFKTELQKIRSQEERNLAFVARQLEEFYSPMVGNLLKIRAKSKLRYKIGQVSNEAWMELVERQPKPFYDSDKYHEPYQKSIEYGNKQFREEIIPLYDQMVHLFTEKYGLANSSTREWYTSFSEFVELWHRWLDESIAADVIAKMNHSEEKLKPFYIDLENQLDELQKILYGEGPPANPV
ncbi:MAG: hypothetical protein GY832_20245 [Chloroflexi bacterium]|nr:hypothetical protein [Chloroflexota bacterium]